MNINIAPLEMISSLLCVCFAKKVYDHDAKYPFRDAALSLNVCPPWCVLADYYFCLRTNRCDSVQVAVGHGTWFLKQCSSMHVFKGPNIVHTVAVAVK